MRRTVAAALVLVAPLALAACSGDGETGAPPGGDGDTAAEGARGHLAEALAALPATTTDLDFYDRAAAAERAGVGETDTDLDDYLGAVRDDGLGLSPLGSFLETADEAGVALDERGVEWSAVITSEDDGGDAASATVLSVAEDVDLDAMIEELEAAGLTREQSESRVRLTGEPSEVTDFRGTIAGGYPSQFYDVTVDSAAGLVVAGDSAADVFTVVDGDAPALADGALDVVLDGVDDLDGADTVRAALDPSCDLPLDSRTTPGELEQLEAESPDFGQPVAIVLARREREVQARLAMADEESAAADAAARQTYLDEGNLFSNGTPFSDYGTAEVSQDGQLVVVDIALADDAPDDAIDSMAVEPVDGPFACY